MAMYVFKDFDELPLTATMAAGVSEFVVDGDKRTETWLQDGDTIRIVEGTNEDILVIDGSSYDSVAEETTFTTVGTTTNPYTLDANVYSLRNPIKKNVGFLEGDGVETAFVCSLPDGESPSEVRRFSTGFSYGELLTEGADQDREWNAPTDQVLLDFTPSEETVVVAYGPGNWLFSEQFLSEGVQESYTEDLYLYITTDYDCVYCGLSEVINSEIDSSWFQIGKEVATDTWDYAASQNFCGFSGGDVIHFRVRLAFPPTSDYTETVRNYYNTALYMGHLTLPTN
jgi:hypothetical protein